MAHRPRAELGIRAKTPHKNRRLRLLCADAPAARRMLGFSMSIRQWFYVIAALALGTLVAWVTLGLGI